MAEFCDKSDGHTVCDFCAHYFFGIESGIYRDNGYCLHPDHLHKQNPGGGCDDYKCFRIDGRTQAVDNFEEKMEDMDTREEKLDKISEKVLDSEE